MRQKKSEEEEEEEKLIEVKYFTKDIIKPINLENLK